MAIQPMGYVQKVLSDVQILTRAEFEGTAITLDSTAFTDGVCKAGAPIGADGTIQNDGDCIGINLFDVAIDRPQATIIRKGYVNNALITTHYGTAIDATAKAVLPMIIFE